MKDLQKLASDFFKENPNVEKLYVSTDGYLFTSKNAADLHKQTSTGKVEIKVFENKPETGEGSESRKELTAKEKIALIENAGTPEEVNALMEGEERKSVLAAAEKKLNELNKTPEK